LAATDQPQVLLLGRCAELVPGLARQGHEPRCLKHRDELLSVAKKVQARVCVVADDAVEPGGIEELFGLLRREMPFTPSVLWLPDGSARTVRDAMAAGARDVVLSPSPDEVTARVQQIIKEQKLLPHLHRFDKKAHDTWRFEGMVSRSQRMWDLFETCVRTAQTNATVLILGETGTGKELIARAIHRRSKRTGRFVALNCGAVPESLIDSELFGHARGAFTGAAADKPGLFRHADGGTLFLDEIGAVPLAVQYRLLRSLQENAIRPVGVDEEIPVDARVIAATSSPLDEAVQAGTFREDLLYRLDVIRIVVPPLRERPEDIILLFEYFCNKLARQYRLERPDLTAGFLDALQGFEWPGNVRQLENYVERLMLTHTNERLTGADFDRLIRPFAGRDPAPTARASGAAPEVDTTRPLPDAVALATARVERAYIETCLRENNGRMGQAARQAGVSRRTLLRKIKQYGIDRQALRERQGP